MMPYDLDTADDVRRAIKQPPGDLKVLLYKYGEFLPIVEIKTRYVILHKHSSGHEYYTEANEYINGAIKVLTII